MGSIFSIVSGSKRTIVAEPRATDKNVPDAASVTVQEPVAQVAQVALIPAANNAADRIVHRRPKVSMDKDM
jgi:hypothetical protein